MAARDTVNEELKADIEKLKASHDNLLEILSEKYGHLDPSHFGTTEESPILQGYKTARRFESLQAQSLPFDYVLKNEPEKLEARLKAHLEEKLRNQMLWFFGVQAAMVGAFIGVIKLFFPSS